MNVGILGTGSIAGAMAETLGAMGNDYIAYAVASRSLEKAETFAKKWHIPYTYGTYEEMAKDPAIDLIYVATPHAMHAITAKLCIENGKAVLVEKAFTANTTQAKEVIMLAKEKNVLLTEAMWTRYMPAGQMVKDLLARGVIGELESMEVEFSAPIKQIDRLNNPLLAGGALLDLGIYPLTFAIMYFGYDIKEIQSQCVYSETGVDEDDLIVLIYQDGKKASLRSCMNKEGTNIGIIYGKKGSLKIYGVNNITLIEIYDENGEIKEFITAPSQISGYEYEIMACKEMLDQGQIECDAMTHDDTIKMMQLMDQLRKSWNIIYPFEEKEDLECYL